MVAGIDLALDVARDVSDAGDVGDGRAAEFHHEASHGGSLFRIKNARIHSGVPGAATLQWRAWPRKSGYRFPDKAML